MWFNMPRSLLYCLNNFTFGKESHVYSSNITQGYSLKKLFVIAQFWNIIIVTHCSHLDNGAYMYILLLKTFKNIFWRSWNLSLLKSHISFSSVQLLSCACLFATPWTTAYQASLSNINSQSPHKPMSLSWWCHPIISSSVVSFSSCPQSFPASGCFQMSQFLAWGGQSIGVSTSASVLPMSTQDWSPLGWTGWISFQFNGLSWAFSTTAQKHQFSGAQLSS